MNFPVLFWLTLFFSMSLMAFVRPAWGVAVYMLSFFACPSYWWWGKGTIGDQRWNLFGGIILLLAVIVGGGVQPTKSAYAAESPKVRRILWLAFAILINATLVHFILAPNRTVSALSYDLLAKFVLLFFMIVGATRSIQDFRIVLLAILLGAGYIGYESTINHRGKMQANRLEGLGAPGAGSSNDLANLMVTVMPLAGVFLLSDRRLEKLITLPIGGFLIDVVLKCNSRGAFLSCIGAGITFLVTAPKKERKKAVGILLLGMFGVWMLMGDPRIVERFLTTFVGDEERDHSAASRLDYWKAGLRLIADHPLGAGGKGFDRVYGPAYIRDIAGVDFEARSVHNGYINEMCEWGIQGGILRMAFLVTTMGLMLETSRRCSRNGDTMGALLGAAFISGTVGFMISSFFGSFIDAEWGYWLGALAVAYGRFYMDQSPTEPTEGTHQPPNEVALDCAPYGGTYPAYWPAEAMRRLPRKGIAASPSPEVQSPLP